MAGTSSHISHIVAVWTMVAAAVLLGSLSDPAIAKRNSKRSASTEQSAAAIPAGAQLPGSDARRAQLANVKAWGYQLRQISPKDIAASPFDLMVIDYSNDRRFYMEWPLPASDVAMMQRRPDGSRRIMLSYFSIGEAEDYRNYWQWEWLEDAANRPSWLADENPEWEGNYPVRFWDPQWQAMMFGGPERYLDSIIRAGFDGVYLDRVDVFGEWLAKFPRAEQEMVRFIERLSAYARRQNPNFLIVIQNGEELIRHAAVRNVIDGIAKESMIYGLKGPDSRNTEQEIREVLKHLRTARKSGSLVLLVEYAKAASAHDDIQRLAAAEGFPLLITNRELGEVLQAEKQPGPVTSPRGAN